MFALFDEKLIRIENINSISREYDEDEDDYKYMININLEHGYERERFKTKEKRDKRWNFILEELKDLIAWRLS